MILFEELLESPLLLRAIDDAGYSTPTPVQEAAIPLVCEGGDLCICAQTGSGKTAAYLLPGLQKIVRQRSERPGKSARILILTPTRELAQQVEQNAKIYGKYFKWLKTASIVGGSSYGLQNRQLSRPLDVLIATPGRLLDHLRQGKIDFDRLEMLVLDEADRMLDMGFIDDVQEIVAALPQNRQTLLFSATLDGAISKLAQNIMRDAKRIDIARSENHGKIDEFLYFCDDVRHKQRLLDHLLRDPQVDQAVVFTATKALTEELADWLYEEKGYAAYCLHGDMPQNFRNRTLRDLHMGRIKILVATDVAARGIDAERISHVFNFDLPKQAEDYVHRIGRTGRAGRHGVAVSFADCREAVKVHQIEKYINRKLSECEIEGMESTRRKKSAHKKPHGKKSFGNNGKKDFGKRDFGAKKPFKAKREGTKSFQNKPKSGAPKRHA